MVPGDPNQNTGGYRYVRLLVEALNQLGGKARVTGVPGRFPRPDGEANTALDKCLQGYQKGAVVVLDGLVMGALPEVVQGHASRLNLVALVHHPLADETGLNAQEQRWFFETERRSLAAIGRVITTSQFTARRLADFGVEPARIRTVEPGVHAIPGPSTSHHPVRTPGDPPSILCVAHLSPRKAQDQLIEALAELRSLPWHCTLAGACDRHPGYSERVKHQTEAEGLLGRVDITGEVSDEQLRDLYRQADLFVFPSLYEGYGMVIDEALAAGLPIITSNGGALALTAARDGVVQYPAGEVGSLVTTLREWLANPSELARHTDMARRASKQLRNWHQAAAEFQASLEDLLRVAQGSTFDSDWLQRREDADHAARSEELTSELAHWCRKVYRTRSPRSKLASALTIVDIGAGRGSNALYLAPKLDVPQQWLLLDQDEALLVEAQSRVAAADIELSHSVVQLEANSLGRHIPDDARLVTASALIDLVSENWLRGLAETVVSRNAALLVVLSYAGRFELDPIHEYDDRVRVLVNRHQRRDKGVGQALGTEATGILKDMMESSGYAVSVAESPWCLGAEDVDLISSLLEGWVEAANEQDTGARVWLSQWFEARKAQLAEGRLSVTVQHLDLLALPGEAP